LIGSVVLSLSLGSELGWRSPFISALFIVCIAIGLLLWWLGRNGYGLINQALLHNPGFLLALLTLFIFQFVNGGVRFLMPFYAELGLGLSVLGSSALLLLYSLSFSPTAVWAGRLTDRIGSEPLVAVSLFLSALLCAIFAALVSQQAIWIFAIFILAFGFLTALFSPANNRRIMQAAPCSCQSEASALLPVALNLGGLLGISVFDTIFSSHFPTTAIMTPEQTMDSGPSNDLLFQGFTHAFALASLVLIVTAICGYKTKRQIR
jgi:predicted MFS family arabinose efflux permease